MTNGTRPRTNHAREQSSLEIERNDLVVAASVWACTGIQMGSITMSAQCRTCHSVKNAGVKSLTADHNDPRRREGIQISPCLPQASEVSKYGFTIACNPIQRKTATDADTGSFSESGASRRLVGLRLWHLQQRRRRRRQTGCCHAWTLSAASSAGRRAAFPAPSPPPAQETPRAIRGGSHCSAGRPPPPPPQQVAAV